MQNLGTIFTAKGTYVRESTSFRLFCVKSVDGSGHHGGAGADPENCFGRSTLDLSRRRRRSETPKALRRRCSGSGSFRVSWASWVV